MRKVTKDDPRYDEWSSRKPSAKKKIESRVETVLGNSEIAKAVAAGSAPIIARSGTTAVRKTIQAIASRAKAVGGVLAGVPATAVFTSPTALGLALAAGAASYYGTRYIIDNWPTKERRMFAASTAYRKARADLAKVLGRELNAEEHLRLATEYKRTIAAIERKG